MGGKVWDGLDRRQGDGLHVFFELLQVVVLLCDLLAELEELLLLAHADGVVFVCLFAFGEGVTVLGISLACLLASLAVRLNGIKGEGEEHREG